MPLSTYQVYHGQPSTSLEKLACSVLHLVVEYRQSLPRLF